MGYKSLLVHLDVGRSNDAPLQFTRELAGRFEARVIGITASAPPFVAYADVGVDGETFEMERGQIKEQIDAAESEFRAAFQDGCANVEWRFSDDDADLVRYVFHQARNTDLVVTAVAQGDAFDSARALHTGALVMQVGRPVLLVPLAARTAKLDRILVGWKDTRETRRAVADALPLMRRAKVTVVEGGDLHAAADRERCDVLVAGAYGHSRVRESMLGGVTKDLLISPHRCSLVSH